MRVYTYSEARQSLARLLDQSRREGKVQIRRRDGELFVVQPAAAAGSPLDVPPVKAGLRPGELEDWVRESRERTDRFWGEHLGKTRPRPRPSRRRRRAP